MKSNSCVPVCENGCVNSICTAPGTCTCLTGFQMENGKCEKVCLDGCFMGTCSDGNCICEEDWVGISCNISLMKTEEIRSENSG